MLTVSHDLAAVESELLHGGISCPGCSGRLRPWGWARSRRIRHGVGSKRQLVWHHPRRGRCSGCGVTHVLLEISLVARRADSAEVLAAAIEAKTTGGQGHRMIAAGLDRPASTVRGWLRAFTASAEKISQMFTSLVVRDAPDAAQIWPKPAANGAGAAISALAAYAQGLGQRFDSMVTVTWVQAGIAACDGRLFCASWWAGRFQHEPALMPAAQARQIGQERLP
jgi:hypothetical protein